MIIAASISAIKDIYIRNGRLTKGTHSIRGEQQRKPGTWNQCIQEVHTPFVEAGSYIYNEYSQTAETLAHFS